jgi:EAL domain-containing protein (putative c-di-GMP-specific phosphodiesterase class I)
MTIDDAVNENFCENFLKTIDELGIDGSKIVLELSEKTSSEMMVRAKKSLSLLRMYNVKIALDDFGTHYSTLDFICELPLDIVKIDKKFVQNAPYSKKNRALMKFCVDISHSLRCKVVAEGIETEDQLRCAKETGVDIGQGFLFSAPSRHMQQIKESPFISLEDFAIFIAARRKERVYHYCGL